MSKPPPYGVDIDAGAQQMASRRMANRVWAHALPGHGGHPYSCCARIAFDERVDTETGDWFTAAIEEDVLAGGAPDGQCMQLAHGD